MLHCPFCYFHFSSINMTFAKQFMKKSIFKFFSKLYCLTIYLEIRIYLRHFSIHKKCRKVQKIISHFLHLCLCVCAVCFLWFTRNFILRFLELSMNSIKICLFRSFIMVIIFAVVKFWDFLQIPAFWINPFVPNAPFLYPLKTSENLMVDWERV